MKNIYKIAILSLCLLNANMLSNDLLSQVNSLNDSRHICAHAKSAINKHKNKSIKAVNPLILDYDVKFYFLDIEVTNISDYISGNVSMKAQVTAASLNTIVLQLINELTVDSVFVNGIKHQFTHSNEEIQINLENAINQNEFFTTQVYYEGFTGEDGMNSVLDENWNKHVTFTLSETWHAKEWWPCKEVLADKADSVYVFITTDYGLKAGSNGLLTATTYFPNGKVRHEWKSYYPIAYYLISIAVSEYQEYNIYADIEGKDEPLLIQNYIYDDPYCLSYYEYNINLTDEIIEVFSEKMGIYPFHEEKYGHCMWPWRGAMEHQTMTSTIHFEFYIVAHELGHQWFGNQVTCGSWQDIWINEGFASYTEYIAMEFIAPEGIAEDQMSTAHYYALQDTTGSVYIPIDEVDDERRVFNWYLSYRKGMALVHMIRFELNDDDLFFQVLKNFQEQFKDSVAIGTDFKAVLEQTSGMDFTDFFNQWYFGIGYPIFDVDFTQNNDTLYLHCVQTTSSVQTALFKTSMEYGIRTASGTTLVRVYQETNDTSYAIPFTENVISVEIDPNNWVLNSTPEDMTKSADIETETFKFYPNPINNFVRIESTGENKITRIEIYNQINQLVFTKLVYDEPYITIYALPKLEKGIYFLKIYGDKKQEMKKVVIN